MSEQAKELFRAAIDAYVELNAPLAAAIRDMDDIMDRLHAEFIVQIFESHAADNLPLQVGVQLALVARFYERIGDHAVNIGGRVEYMVTGWMPKHAGAVKLRSTLLGDGAPSSGPVIASTAVGVEEPGDG